MGVSTAERVTTPVERRETMIIGNERVPAADGRTFYVETPARRGEIINLAGIFRADIVDTGDKHLTLEVTGDAKKLRAFLDIVRPYGVQELVRTGVVGIARN